ncbi:hypothetical protein [Salinibacter phage 8_2]
MQSAVVPRHLSDRSVPGMLLVPDEAGRVAMASVLLALVGPEAGLVFSKLLAVVIRHKALLMRNCERLISDGLREYKLRVGLAGPRQERLSLLPDQFLDAVNRNEAELPAPHLSNLCREADLALFIPGLEGNALRPDDLAVITDPDAPWQVLSEASAEGSEVLYRLAQSAVTVFQLFKLGLALLDDPLRLLGLFGLLDALGKALAGVPDAFDNRVVVLSGLLALHLCLLSDFLDLLLLPFVHLIERFLLVLAAGLEVLLHLLALLLQRLRVVVLLDALLKVTHGTLLVPLRAVELLALLVERADGAGRLVT